jgi:uncharacterized protein
MNSSKSMMNRRSLLMALAGSLPGLALAETMHASAAPGAMLRIAATWRGPRETDAYSIGMLGFDADARALRVLWSQPLPGRAHGLTTLPDGSLVVVAVRPGRWLNRYDAEGHLLRAIRLDDVLPRHFTGHAVASRDGRTLLTGETDPRDDRGFIGVRDAITLQEISAWPSGGIEPHDLRLDADGALIVANGGIRRAAADRKRDLDRMQSSIAKLDATTGALLGQWRLPDQRLSLRHMAWSHDLEGRPLLGIGLQAEHDDPGRRGEAPVLAIWDGAQLSIPTYAADADGYAGDICAAPLGGFLLSSNRTNSALWWRPDQPGRLSLVARLTEAYALGSHFAGGSPDAVLISSARGAALWHPARTSSLLPWPAAMVMENHWLALG